MDARLTWKDKQEIVGKTLEAVGKLPAEIAIGKFEEAVASCWTDGLHRFEPHEPAAAEVTKWGAMRRVLVFRPSGWHLCTVILRAAPEADFAYRVEVMIPTPMWPEYAIDEYEPGSFSVLTRTGTVKYGFYYIINDLERERFLSPDAFDRLMWRNVDHALKQIRALIERSQ
jgi:hypothetical protein